MPHSESPKMNSLNDHKVPVTGAHAPPQSDIDALLESVLDAKTSAASVDAAYSLTTALQESIGALGIRKYGITERLEQGAKDKKNVGRKEGAMNGLGAFYERMPTQDRLSEVVFLRQATSLLALAFDALADKAGSVRESAQYAVDELFKSLTIEALVVGLLPNLLTYLGKSTGKWQGTVGALQILGKMADKAKIGTGTAEEERDKDILRDSMGKRLAEMIPVVEGKMQDIKSEVARQAVKTMTSLTTLLQNDDVAPRIPLLVETMKNPSFESTAKAIHALSQTTFVAIVTSPVLALLTPLLERALNNPQTSNEVRRQTTVVVHNLTKLVHDPVEAHAFLPRLQPGVKRVLDSASLPEVREIAANALKTINTALGDKNTHSEAATLRTSTADATGVLSKAVTNQGGLLGDAPKDLVADTLQFCGEMLAEIVNLRAFERVAPCIEPYFIRLAASPSAISSTVHTFYIEEDHKKFGGPIVDDDGEEEIVNATFSLGYGGMLLLSHTNLRLLKGHRYGLCGRNGAGKSTLMRSIADNKLEGFPTAEVVRSCFVEHNQGEDADLSILEYCCKDPKLADESRERISHVLEEVGFTAGPEGRQSQKVGSLSGGWKMKLALARAMLMRADVFLLDEPTNHLDVANVHWLEEYLKSHTEITSLIVSHDSGFLDEVCTDIYHYENKKLVRYKGNLAAFVRVKPEAKSYYTLSASQVQFKFPPPGILTGVKSNTRAILRMTDSTYTYPNAPAPSLHNVTCSLSLSSRVAIIGPNGAGKSTLIKILTGEVIPQQGKVEKHPNLRIGYIKQHALEHVEMHMEKTPNQYLQWRYAHGDDREVLMKQTRILTAEDKLQMDKEIDLGDGKAARRVESLVGRQKYKKSFQYEVKWVGWLPRYNSQVSRETLLEWGFAKLVQEFDDHEASREGLGFRQLEPRIISKHFEDVGLDPEIANHNEISGLSGGQKVKVVLAGAMWNNPHLLVLDEPTNFLDRDSLGGLAVAIRDYKGGVVMISHNEEFVGALCPEQWHVNDGRVTHKGHLAVDAGRFEDSRSASPIPGFGGHGAHSGIGSPALGASLNGSSTAVSSAAPSTNASAVNSEAEGSGDMKFRSRKKKKMTRAQLKEREVRRRLRHIEWLNSPKGTPHPRDTDDEGD